MKLYELAATPSCRRVNIFLKEIGIDIPRQVINVRDGENLSDEFQSKSITGKIPVLELDDGT
ncbi:glutathione S-transferase N-terminal domain-containing protein, partial [Vibrio anguillarum]